MASSPPKLVLVDAHSLIFQVYHAIRSPMSAPDGRPTNAVYGFTGDIFTIRDELKPDYLVFAFDRPGPTFRSKIAEDYKANREPPPADLIIQIPMIEQVVEGFNLPVIAHDDYEADDVIATLVKAGCDRGMEVVICTSDKDCRQLLCDTVRMYNLRKRTYFDAAALHADWGIAPNQVIDFQTLVGDSVDNVHGVPGIGPKTAGKLLQEFGTLDNLLQRLDQIKQEKTRKAIRDAADTLKTSKQLVRLAADMPIKLDWDAWKVHDYNAERLLALFAELGFRGYAERVRGSHKAQQQNLFEAGEEANDFAFGANAPTQTDWQAEYVLVDDAAKFKSFVSDLRKQTRIAIDLETTGLDPMREEIVGIAITWQSGAGWYLPVKGPAGAKTLDRAAVFDALKPILENPKIAKINQNIKFDQLTLRAHGIEMRGVTGDSMLADYLLRAGERSHNLDDLARRLLNHENIHIEELIGKGKNQIRMDQVAPERIAMYAGEDVDVAWRLTEKLEAELEHEKLKGLYDELEVPLIAVLTEMEFNGIRLDVPFLKKLSGEMDGQLVQMEREAHQLAGRPFNAASPKQLREILFDELKLPVQKKTSISGASSTDQETLEQLAVLHPLPKKIVEFRQVAKLKGTYVDALPNLVNPKTGRLHTSFNQTVAATGRLSSSDPNLQNIPARTEQGRQIRRAFLPESGWSLVTADYSQIELRLLAHVSGDANLKRAFAERQDIHSAVAARIFNVPEAKVNSEQRRVAKTVNFGVIYGMSPHGLATRLGIDRESATRFIDDYFAGFPAVQDYQAKLLANCAQTGFVSTLMGRRRRISGVRSRTTIKGLNQPEREAVNMEIQGSAADMMKRAMLAVHRRLGDEKLQSRMLLTVHDELVFEGPDKELRKLASLVREEMIGAMKLDVPVEVDIAAGPNWLDVEEMT